MQWVSEGRARWAIWLSCAMLVGVSVSLFAWYWPGALPEDNASGVWTALAQDFAHGVFYRPPADAFGFGGTRYMPLFFMLHAALIRYACDPVTAGVVLTLLSILLLDVGTFVALRELGLDRSLALPLALLPHAAVAFQVLSVQIKGDFLAAACVMWGTAGALRYQRRPGNIVLAAVIIAFFAAFLTKFTAFASGLIVCVCLYTGGRRRAAIVLMTMLAGLAALASFVIGAASDGRWFTSFAAVAGGGSRLIYALAAPIWLLHSALQDPVFIAIVVVAALYAGVRLVHGPRGFVERYFAGTALLTLAIFASPGTDWNHLLDLLGASALVLGATLVDRPADVRKIAFLPAGVAAVTFVSLLPGMVSVKSVIERNGKPERWQVGAIAARLGGGAHEVLSEDPIVPVVLGERPVVLDPFNLRLLAARRPEVAASFEQRMDTHRFGAVILVDYSASDRFHLPHALAACAASNGAPCYGGVVFPAGFLRELERDYVLSFIERPFVVYTPRPMTISLSTGAARP
ncbi:MAG TPA: hypothetical protein VLV45_00380 [Gemmatimonadales bacterium]|nr:hypothetical protein [Gemmatimonadales bacterium]